MTNLERELKQDLKKTRDQRDHARRALMYVIRNKCAGECDEPDCEAAFAGLCTMDPERLEDCVILHRAIAATKEKTEEQKRDELDAILSSTKGWV